MNTNVNNSNIHLEIVRANEIELKDVNGYGIHIYHLVKLHYYKEIQEMKK